MDMLNRTFGKLKVKSFNGRDNWGTLMWDCVCECGEERVVAGSGLRAGRNKSCGCSSPRFTSERVSTHGATKTRAYRIFACMHNRCSDKAKGNERRLYYDKGIRVCQEWGKFERFLSDMGSPKDYESIDRIDGSKGYSKGNCRWATAKQQANNTSSNHRVVFNGEEHTISEWSDITGIKANTLVYRIRRGWNIDRVFQKKPIPIHSLRKNKRQRSCVICGSLFIPRTTQLRDGVGKLCSQKCNAIKRTLECNENG